MGNSGFGSSGMGNSGFGSSGMGNAGIGGSSLGGNPFSQNGSSNQGNFIGVNPNGQFIGVSQQGNSSMGTQNFRGGGFQNYGGGNSFGSNGRQNSQYSNYGSGGYGQQQNKTQIGTTWRIDFEPISPDSDNISSTLTKLLQTTPGVRSSGTIVALHQNRTLVLQGEVATTREKKLAERMARLKPGVDRVQNDLTVSQPDSPSSRDSSH
jgi:osmotically-inducible protein OsmY